jgi:hypothetical protein
MSINSHLSTCVGTQSPKYLEMAQGHISLSRSEIVIVSHYVWLCVLGLPIATPYLGSYKRNLHVYHKAWNMIRADQNGICPS